MKAVIKKINGLEFICRPDTSDEKTINEVIGNDVYEKKGIKILPGEHWIDLGGNIGAFTVLALSKGATVSVYEPDPLSYEILCENIKRNGFKANARNKAVTEKANGYSYLNISSTGQYWRNSLMRTFNGANSVKVETVNFKNVISKGFCVKMDIEGCEMPIIDDWDIEGIPKMVFEWSFDIDDNIDRYRAAVEKMEKYFSVVKADKIKPEHKTWLKSWFPPCKNVYCSNP